MELKEVIISHAYQEILRRSPEVDELSYWMAHLTAGGLPGDIERALLGGYEFVTEVKEEFWAAHKRRPSEPEVALCRTRVAGGMPLRRAVCL